MTHRGPFPQPGGAGGRAAAQRRGAGPRRWERWSKALRGSLQATSTRAAVSFIRPLPPLPQCPQLPGQCSGSGTLPAQGRRPRGGCGRSSGDMGMEVMRAEPAAKTPTSGQGRPSGRGEPGCRTDSALLWAPVPPAQGAARPWLPPACSAKPLTRLVSRSPFPFVATGLVITLSTLGLCCVWHIAPQVLAIS